jgi:hypothetical protein
MLFRSHVLEKNATKNICEIYANDVLIVNIKVQLMIFFAFDSQMEHGNFHVEFVIEGQS